MTFVDWVFGKYSEEERSRETELLDEMNRLIAFRGARLNSFVSVVAYLWDDRANVSMPWERVEETLEDMFAQYVLEKRLEVKGVR